MTPVDSPKGPRHSTEDCRSQGILIPFRFGMERRPGRGNLQPLDRAPLSDPGLAVLRSGSRTVYDGSVWCGTTTTYLISLVLYGALMSKGP